MQRVSCRYYTYIMGFITIALLCTNPYCLSNICDLTREDKFKQNALEFFFAGVDNNNDMDL